MPLTSPAAPVARCARCSHGRRRPGARACAWSTATSPTPTPAEAQRRALRRISTSTTTSIRTLTSRPTTTTPTRPDASGGLARAQGSPEGAVAGVGVVGRDPAGGDELAVEAGQVAPRHAHVDVVGQVPAGVERHEPEVGDPRLLDVVGGLAAVLRVLHPAVLGDGPQAVEDRKSTRLNSSH